MRARTATPRLTALSIAFSSGFTSKRKMTRSRVDWALSTAARTGLRPSVGCTMSSNGALPPAKLSRTVRVEDAPQCSEEDYQQTARRRGECGDCEREGTDPHGRR